MALKQFINKLKPIPGIAEVLAFAGAIVFFVQAGNFARIQSSILDEGLYLVKGFLFASGRYIPFQPDGPWTNQMPFSYMIPGAIQIMFGTGLRTGRYFSIFLALLILLGLWILARRLGGRWWATGIVWMVAVNPAFANGYSMAVSQVLVACILTWILVLALDDKAALWRLILSSILAGLLILVRVNMTPVLPLLLLFIFWQFGKRTGLLATLAGGLVVLLGHALYWPGILQIWASWIPSAVTPFLDPWRIDSLGVPVWNPDIGMDDRLASFWDGVRFNFIPLAALAFFGTLILDPKSWKNHFHYRTAVFLSLLSSLLFAAHAWAALLKNYCVYCFAGYLEFFSPIILLLIILAYQSYRPQAQSGFFKRYGYTFFAILFVLVIFSGVGYGAAREIGPWLIEQPIPRISAGQIQPGTVPLWGLLNNSLGIDYKTIRWLAPTLAGFVFALLLVSITGLSYALYHKGVSKHAREPAKVETSLVEPDNIVSNILNFGLVLGAVVIIIGALLSPTVILTGSDQNTFGPTVSAALSGSLEQDPQAVCQGNVLTAMEQAGAHLAKHIPPGASVYWQGSLSATPLLAIPEAHIYPAQLNDGYSFRQGGDVEKLRQFGLWNEVLRDRWLNEADFIIVQERYYNQEWKQFVESGAFDELPTSPRTDPCADNSALRIFRRL